jgi:predicted metal-dependent hydrolase
MDIEELWRKALEEHNSGDYHEAHEIFEDLWLELDDRQEKDIVQTLAQADALAVHIETGNMRAAQRLMRQLPELIQMLPLEYKGTSLIGMKKWIEAMIATIPLVGEPVEISSNKNPPKLV